MVALDTLVETQSKGTDEKPTAVAQLLDYCATRPDEKLCYRASGMKLCIHSDVSYLSELHARSRDRGHFLLLSKGFNDNK